MTQRLCPRCRTVLRIEDESSLIFCFHCGAPQVRLSEELRELAERQLAGEAHPTHPAIGEPLPASAGPSPLPNPWRGALQCAGLAGAIAAGLTLASFPIPPVALLCVFWIVGAPIVTVGIFAARFRRARITGDFGARLGLLCGLAIALAISTISTTRILLERFAFHAGADIDTQMSTVFAQLRANSEAQMATQSGAAAAAPFLNMLNLPEFRVGLLLSSAALFLAMYLVYSALAGAFAGYLRSRSHTQ